MVRAWMIVAVLASGCVSSESVACGNATCPAGTVCGHDMCLTPDQTTACSGKIDGDRCAAGDFEGVCDLGFCIEGCGDAERSGIEECDDGNLRSRDGCSSTCLLETLSWSLWQDEWHGVGGHVAAYVPAQKKVMRFGGYDTTQQIAELWERTSDRRWTKLPNALSARHYAASAFDSTRGAWVVFGGIVATGFSAETWEYAGGAWTNVATANAPSARYGASMFFDSTRGRVVLFGGLDGTYRDDTWEYDGTNWTPVTITGSKPSGRHFHTTTWDTVRNRAVLLGGVCAGGAVCTDQVWRYDNASKWTAITATGPAARYGAAVAYMPIRDRVVMFGGNAVAALATNDTWELNVSTETWTQSTLPASPPGRLWHTLTYDTEHQTLVLIGGINGPTIFDDTWELLPSGSWANLSPHFAPVASYLPLAYNEKAGTATAVCFDPFAANQAGEGWHFDGETWRFEPIPSGRSHYSIAYDAVRDLTVVFGGLDYQAGGVAARTLVRTQSWGEIAGTQPPPRAYGTMTQAGPDGSVVLYGGAIDTTQFGDTWEFDGAAWTQIATPPDLPLASIPMMTYDPVARRVVMLDEMSRTWTYESRTWTRLATTVAPPQRKYGVMTFWRDRARPVMFGGGGLTDLWELDGDTWRELAVEGELPTARLFTGLTYHAKARALMMFGGAHNVGSFDDTWLLSFRSDTPDEVCANGTDDDGDKRVDADDPDCN